MTWMFGKYDNHDSKCEISCLNFMFLGKKTWVDKYLIIYEDKRTSECELFNCSELFYFMLLQSNSRLIKKPADPICKKGQMNKFTKKLNTLLPQQWSRTLFSVVLPICTAHCLLNSVWVKRGCDQIPITLDMLPRRSFSNFANQSVEGLSTK